MTFVGTQSLLFSVWDRCFTLNISFHVDVDCFFTVTVNADINRPTEKQSPKHADEPDLTGQMFRIQSEPQSKVPLTYRIDRSRVEI